MPPAVPCSVRTGHVGWGTEWLQHRIPGGLDCRVQYVLSYFRLPHFSSQTFSVAVPADKTVRWIIAPFTLPIFMARHRLIVRTSSIRQVLECLFDFIVLQFDTPLNAKKAGTFDFSKVPALPI